MTKREAIEIFNKRMDCKDAYQADPSCDENCYSCEYYASAEEEKEAMQMAVSALKKQEQDRWIPCKERPPEKPGWYAITVHNEAIPEDEDGPEIPEKWGTGAAYWDWVYPNDPTKKEWGKWWVNAYDYDGYITSDDCITAWRPLPEAYEAEEKE